MLLKESKIQPDHSKNSGKCTTLILVLKTKIIWVPFWEIKKKKMGSCKEKCTMVQGKIKLICSIWTYIFIQL